LFQKVLFKPGESVGLHHHERQTEVFVVLSGTALFQIAGRQLHPGAGDVILCEPGDKHRVENKSGEDFLMAVFKTNAPREKDLVWD